MPTVTAAPFSVSPAELELVAQSDRLFPDYIIDADLDPQAGRLALPVGTFSRDIEAVPHEGVTIFDLSDLTTSINWPLDGPATLLDWWGEWIYVGMESGELFRVRPEAGEAFRLADLGDDFISAMAVSPDGSKLAIATFGSLKPWLLDAESGEILAELPEHQDVVKAIGWSPDGSVLGTAGGNTLRLWQADGLELIQELPGHDHFIYEVEWSPDGSLVATASEDGSVIVRQADSGEQIYRLYPAESNLRALAISPDGEYLAAGSNNGAIPIWNLVSGQLVALLRDDWAVHSVFWLPDGRLVSASIPVSVNQGGRVLLWGTP
jgi:WD40 repeat protein